MGYYEIKHIHFLLDHVVGLISYFSLCSILRYIDNVVFHQIQLNELLRYFYLIKQNQTFYHLILYYYTLFYNLNCYFLKVFQFERHHKKFFGIHKKYHYLGVDELYLNIQYYRSHIGTSTLLFHIVFLQFLQLLEVFRIVVLQDLI